MQIVPAVLAHSAEELKAQLAKTTPLSDRIQIDIADGRLVNGKTLSHEEIMNYLVDNSRLLRGKKFDFHLMVYSWEDVAFDLADIEEYVDINLILFHYKVFAPIELYPYKMGVVFDPEDEIDESVLDAVAAVQIMTVHPGAQGAAFLPEQLTKIKQLRELNYKGEILIDGGVNDKTLPLVLKQSEKPDVVSVGSYFTNAANPQKHFETLSQLLK